MSIRNIIAIIWMLLIILIKWSEKHSKKNAPLLENTANELNKILNGLKTETNVNDITNEGIGEVLSLLTLYNKGVSDVDQKNNEIIDEQNKVFKNTFIDRCRNKPINEIIFIALQENVTISISFPIELEPRKYDKEIDCNKIKGEINACAIYISTQNLIVIRTDSTILNCNEILLCEYSKCYWLPWQNEKIIFANRADVEKINPLLILTSELSGCGVRLTKNKILHVAHDQAGVVAMNGQEDVFSTKRHEAEKDILKEELQEIHNTANIKPEEIIRSISTTENFEYKNKSIQYYNKYNHSFDKNKSIRSVFIGVLKKDGSGYSFYLQTYQCRFFYYINDYYIIDHKTLTVQPIGEWKNGQEAISEISDEHDKPKFQ